MRRLISLCVALAMTFTSVTGYAQGLELPAVGTMIAPSAAFSPVILRGMTVYPDKPLTFDFIVDTGDEKPADAELRATTQKLVNYFLAAMTVPEGDLWVNLSPVEKDRIITEPMAKTELGRDLLAQDYLLKQLTASLIYPENELGKTFWKRVYDEAYQKFGTTEIPVDTFNKVWIMPETASVYEKNGTVYVTKAHMKVMLASDYEALKGSAVAQTAPAGNAQELSKEIIREIVLPAIETEINEGKNFVLLRQVFHSLILAQWYKKAFAESALRKAYGDQNKVAGIDVSSPELKETIYQQYLAAYKKGVFNYIKEETDRLTNEPVPRKYFSGGFDDAQIAFLKADTGDVVGAGKGLQKARVEVLTATGVLQTVNAKTYPGAQVRQVIAAIVNGFGHAKVMASPQISDSGKVLFLPADISSQRAVAEDLAAEFNAKGLVIGFYSVKAVVEKDGKGVYVALQGTGEAKPTSLTQGANRFVNWLRENFRDSAQADVAKALEGKVVLGSFSPRSSQERASEVYAALGLIGQAMARQDIKRSGYFLRKYLRAYEGYSADGLLQNDLLFDMADVAGLKFVRLSEESKVNDAWGVYEFPDTITRGIRLVFTRNSARNLRQTAENFQWWTMMMQEALRNPNTKKQIELNDLLQVTWDNLPNFIERKKTEQRIARALQQGKPGEDLVEKIRAVDGVHTVRRPGASFEISSLDQKIAEGIAVFNDQGETTSLEATRNSWQGSIDRVWEVVLDEGRGFCYVIVRKGHSTFPADWAQTSSPTTQNVDAAQADVAKVLYDGHLQAVTNPRLQKLLYNLQHPGTNKVASDVSLEAFLDPIKGPAQLALGKGGLGFLTGETWGAYSDLQHWNVMGVMPLYSLDRGNKEVDWDRQEGVQPVFVQDDLGRKSVLSFDVEFKGKKERVYIYWVNMNGMPVFVIKHGVLFRKLYPGGDEQAIQYGFLGRAYVELMKVLGVRPEVLRLSEPQLIFVITAMKNDIEAAPKDSPFLSTKVAMTTHTPEAAALPVWHNIEWLKQLVGADLVRNDIIYAEKVNAAGAMAYHADIINGVSPEHKDVTIEAVLPSFADKVTGIQNGSDPRLWRSEQLNRLIEKKGIAAISGQELFDIGSAQKHRLNEYLSANGLVGFSEVDRPLFAALRRLVEYKSQAIFIPMIRWIVGDPDKEYDSPLGRQKGLGANLLLGGEALDGVSPEWMRQFKALANDPEIKGKFIVAERPTGTEFMQLATSGADSWLVMPWITREASGTSDQRAGFNGRVVIATATGGPLEWINNGVNGWLINPFSFAQAKRNGEDADEFRKIVQVFQNRETWALTQFYEGGRKEFAQHMKELVDMYREPGRERLYGFMQGSFQAAHQRVSIHRMVQEYGLMFDSVMDGTGVRGFERKLQDFAKTWDDNKLWQQDGKSGDAAQATPIDEGVLLSPQEQLAVFDVVSGRATGEQYLIASTWVDADKVKAAVQAKLDKQQVIEVVPVRSTDVIPGGSLVIGPLDIHRLGQDNDLLPANYTVYDVRLDGGARFYVAFDFAQTSVSVRGLMDRLKAEGVAPLRKEFDEGRSEAVLDVLFIALQQYGSGLLLPAGETKAKEILAVSDFMKVISGQMNEAYVKERAERAMTDSVRVALAAANPQQALQGLSGMTVVPLDWNSFTSTEGGWAGERFVDANGTVPRDQEKALVSRLESRKATAFLVTKTGEGSLLAVIDNAMGGIDLNNISVGREGELMNGVMTDKALEQMLTASPGLMPVIINITPIADILPILGLGRDGVSPVARAVSAPSVWGVVREEEFEKV